MVRKSQISEDLPFAATHWTTAIGRLATACIRRMPILNPDAQGAAAKASFAALYEKSVAGRQT